MSWSVNATGLPQEVKKALEEQFNWPLAPKPAGLADDQERETVRNIKHVIMQTLDSYDLMKPVQVSASGYIGWQDWTARTGCFQNVSVNIQPYNPPAAAVGSGG